jgi:hypothetical protein
MSVTLTPQERREASMKRKEEADAADRAKRQQTKDSVVRREG